MQERRGKARSGLIIIVLVNTQFFMRIVFQLYDVLSFDATAVINVGYLSIYHPQS